MVRAMRNLPKIITATSDPLYQKQAVLKQCLHNIKPVNCEVNAVTVVPAPGVSQMSNCTFADLCYLVFRCRCIEMMNGAGMQLTGGVLACVACGRPGLHPPHKGEGVLMVVWGISGSESKSQSLEGQARQGSIHPYTQRSDCKGRRVSVGSRPAWFTHRVPGQKGIHSETLLCFVLKRIFMTTILICMGLRGKV